MARLKWIVAFLLLTILCHLLALAASQEGDDPALDAQLEREKQWDEWKKLGKVGALVGEKVIDWLVVPPLNTILSVVLSSSDDKLLKMESKEYRAIKDLTHIVERQHRTSMRRFNAMQLLVKELIIDNDYNKDVEMYLWSLRGVYMEYSGSIGKSKELQKIRMDRLGEECELYKPIQSLRKLQNTMQHCFMSAPIFDNSSLLHRRKRTAQEGPTLERTGNAITLFHDEMFTKKIRRYTENLCKLERAYRVQENQSESLSSTVDAIMANVKELIVFSRICSAVVYKDNALERDDALNTAAQIGAEINRKMVEWAENRFERAWPDEMRSKAKEIIERFTQADEIPREDFAKLSDRIRTAMNAMASNKYAHQVMLIAHNNVFPFSHVYYRYSENFKYNFAVKNVKKVSAIVSRHIYSLADCQYRSPTYLDAFIWSEILNNRTLTPNNVSFDFTHMPFNFKDGSRYHTIFFVMVHLKGNEKHCLEHRAFFTRSMENYEEKCLGAAMWMVSQPRSVRHSLPFTYYDYSKTFCAWFFGFM